MTNERTVVAIAGDLHVNSTVAVCPPVVMLDDGGEYRASKPQRWLWREWVKFWGAVGEARQGARLVVVLNGELADDNRHATTQIISRNPADMLKLSAETLRPAIDLLGEGDRLFVLRGTEAHSGVSACLDEEIARDLGAEPESEGVFSHWRLRLEAGGVRFDIAHHPPGGGGRRPWTRSNFAATLAAMAFWESAERQEKPPHLLVRGHVHRPGDSYDAYRVRALVLPSWQLTSAYGHRIGGDALPVGAAWVTCEGGQYGVSKRFTEWPVERYK